MRGFNNDFQKSAIIFLVWFFIAGVLQAQKTLLTIEPTENQPRNSEGDLIELTDGRICLIYTRFTGGTSDHAAADLAMRISQDGGNTWSDDKLVVRRQGGSNVMSVSLLRLSDGRIALFYLLKRSLEDCRPFLRISSDECASFGEATLCIPEKQGYYVLNNDRAVQLDSGRLILPVALHNEPGQEKPDWAGRVMCYFSDDVGKTWRRSQTVLIGRKPNGDRVTVQEPGVVQLKDNRLMMFCRTNAGSQYVAYSPDDGDTWSELSPSNLASPVSPATIERIPTSDQLLCVWNDHSGTHPFPAGKRSPLCVAISPDEGKTWSRSQVIEADPEGWYCYTAMAFVKDRVLLAYCAGDKQVGGLNRLKVVSLSNQQLSDIATAGFARANSTGPLPGPFAPSVEERIADKTDQLVYRVRENVKLAQADDSRPLVRVVDLDRNEKKTVPLADESKRQGGKGGKLAGVLAKAKQEPLDSFEVLDGFQMQLVAREPNVIEPIVIAYDENGAMFVAEFLKFPAKNGKSDGPDGRIRLLRDTDGDGVYENSNVFATGLAWPTGICPWKGGVFVVAAPDLWYLKDTDKDGKADIRKKLFTGFGMITEEGTANNLIWGLDNWIYGAGSNSGGDIRPADQPNARAVSLRSRDFRFHPATGKLEAISGSEQFGNTFDDWNNRFLCQNSKPAVHVVLPARYLARNPYLPVPAVRRDIWKGNRVYRASPIEAWRLQRTKMRLAEDRNYSAPSVAHDVFTACTGVTIYRGAAYPEKYRGNLFVADVQSNLIHRRLMNPSGVSFESLRADKETEMVRSTDNWFRPVNLINAPDGTLHVVDMYREVIETPDSLPEAILANLDLDSGDEMGRIYRLAPHGFTLPKPPQLGSASTEDLVRELANPNGWWRDTAGRLLFERQDRRAIEPLHRLLRETESELAQLHALHALEGLDALNADDLTLGLASTSPGVREHAVRLAESRLQASESLLEQVLSLADDPNMRVRFQVAFSLGETDDRRAAEAMANIARRDARDTWMQIAVLSSSLDLAVGMLERLLSDGEFAATSGGQQFLRQLALVVGGRNQPVEVVGVLQLIETSPAAKREDVRRPILLGLGDGLRRSQSSLSQYVKDSTEAAEMLSGLIENAKKTLASPASAAGHREQAIEILAHGRFDDVRDTLAAMLDSRQAPTVQLAAVRALSSFTVADVPVALIDAWQGLSPPVRGEVVETLLSRREWTGALLDAIEGKHISPGYIAPIRKSRLVKHSDAKIRARAEKIFGTATLSPRKKVVDAYRSALELTGNVKRGAKVFEQNCMTCHRVAGRGHDVGPNLATIQNRTPEALMIQILDPNREVLANYTQYVIVLETGRIVTGLIAGESPTSIQLKRAENVLETILRQNIDEIDGSGKSLMPEGLEQKINQQQMSDLIAYLTNAEG